MQQSLDFSLKLAFPSREQAKIILASIEPEIVERQNKRSSTIIKIKNTCILIGIKALDKTALKASLNSCLKSIILAKEILEVK